MILKGKLCLEQKVTREGDDYLYCTIEAFDNNQYFVNIFKSNSYNEDSKLYNDALKLKDKYVALEFQSLDKWSIRDLISIKESKDALIQIDIKKYQDALRCYLASFENESYSKFIKTIFNRIDVKTKFFTAPSSDKKGYSYKGGLVQHTVDLLNMIDTQSEYLQEYLEVDIEFLKVLAFIHNVGKVNCYEIDEHGVINLTLKAKFLGIKQVTNEIIIEELLKADYLTEEEKLIIQHSCISIDTRYGKSELCKVKESLIFSSFDYQTNLIADLAMIKHNRFNEEEFMKLNGQDIYTSNL